MSSSGDLLRMLVPAVSPVPTRGPGAAPHSVPIESRSFDSLLEEVRLTDAVVEPKAGTGANTEAQPPDPGTKPADNLGVLSGLLGIESIQNASLRRIIADAAGRG